MPNGNRKSDVISSRSESIQNLIASRAYEKWCQRGRPLWEDQQDWFDALAEIEQGLRGRAVSNNSGRASIEIKRGDDLFKFQEYEGTPLWVGGRYRPGRSASTIRMERPS